MKHCFFLICMFTLNLVIAQENFIHFGQEVGLPESRIYDLCKDGEGYLWIASSNGLFRFDGKNLSPYYYDPDDEFSISSDAIESLLLDSNHRLWVGTDGGGLNLFDADIQGFVRFRQDLEDSLSISGNRNYSIFEDVHGNIWVGAEDGGINLFNPADSSFQHWIPSPNPSTVEESYKNNIRPIIQDPNSRDHLLLGSRGGLFRFDLRTKQFYEFKALSGVLLTKGMLYDEGILWLSTWGNGLIAFNLETEVFQQYHFDMENSGSMSHNIMFDIERKSDDELWIATNKKTGGLGIFNTIHKEFSFPLNQKEYDKGQVSSETACLVADRENLWVGTERGISLYSPHFNRFHDKNKQSFGLENEIVSAAYENDMYAYFGTRDGELIRVSRWGQRKIRISDIQGAEFKMGSILEIIETHDEEIWLSALTPGGGLFRADFEHELFEKPIDRYHNGSDQWDAVTIFEDYKKQIWIGNNGKDKGIHVFQPEKREYEYYGYTPGSSLSTSDDASYSFNIIEDRKLCIWFSSDKGLHLFDPAENNMRIFYENMDNGGLSSSNTKGLLFDAQGRLWVSFYNAGLNIFDVDKNELKLVKRFVKKDGLPDLKIGDLIEDGEGNIWLGSYEGISCVNPESFEIKSFTAKEGISAKDCRYELSYLPYSKLMFVNMQEDYLLFDPTEILKSAEEPSLAFNLFKVNFQERKGVFNEDDDIILQHDENNIEIGFRDISFLYPNDSEYFILCEGVNSTWQAVFQQEQIQYVDLRPGSYRFRVKTKNKDGLWSDEKSLKFTIRPAYYQTSWFISLSIFLVLAGLLFLYRFRIKKLKQEQEKEKEVSRRIAELELTALRSQMNPHFIFNTLNSIKYYILKHKNKDAAIYLDKFSKLIRLVLNHSIQELIPLEAELDALQLYMGLEQLRLSKGFDFSISIAPDIDSSFELIPPLMLQPFVENAIWHGLMPKNAPGRIVINVYRIKEILTVSIEDNGIGREASLKKKTTSPIRESKGLGITKDRMNLNIHVTGYEIDSNIEDLTDAKGNANGTRVTIMINRPK